MLLSAYPYIIYLLLGLPNEMIMDLLFAGMSLLLFGCISNKEKIWPPKIVLVSMIIQFVGWFFFSLYHNDTSYFTRLFFLLFTFVILTILCSKKSILKFGYVYNGLILLQSVMGAIAFVLIFLSILSPIMFVENGDRIISFYGLTSTNTVIGNFIRVGGFFDEPGALASWGIFTLVINKLVFNNKIIEWGLIISLLFTFSAAFFVLLPLYVMLFYHNKIKQLIIALLFFIPVVIITFNLLSTNAFFLHITTERFEGGEIQSARTDMAESAKAVFDKNIYMGVGGRKMESLTEFVSDNPYEILAKDGIIGYIITYFPLLLLCAKYYRKKDVLFGGILLFLCYQQRPFHINEMHYFMLYYYMAIVCYKYDKLGAEYDILAYITNNQVKKQ